MMNFKSIIIPAGLSFVFGIYSLYGVLVYYLDISYKSDISNLKKTLYKTSMKYEDLDKKYDDLLSEFTKLKCRVFNLTNKDINDDLFDEEINLQLDINVGGLAEITRLSKLEHSEVEVEHSEVEVEHSDVEVEHSDVEVEHSDVEVKKSEVEVENSDVNRIVPYLIDDNVEHEFDFLEETGIINPLYLSKSRVRSVSITEIDWTGIAKKIFFG